MKELFKYGFILALICMTAAGLLAGINMLTRGRIHNQAQAEELNSLKEVLPAADYFEPVKENDTILYYIGKNPHKITVGFVFKTGGKGYSSVIETVAGLTPDGTITGIKILNQNETPGLGARICEVKDDKTIGDVLRGVKQESARKPWFQQQFSGKKTVELDQVEAITGATISSRAVIESVKKRAVEILEMTGKDK
ncbi:MAG: RnfABCDGE type electron transport complex subunit G [Candidatus Omnitrophica bacterium]|nr:RnfABCDGE type electron transport complex subunit G [Candidatus Omnitrophota bacterium]